MTLTIPGFSAEALLGETTGVYWTRRVSSRVDD